MTESIKISTDELQEFNTLKSEIQKNIFEFGELYLQKMELDSLYKELSDKELELRKKTSTFKQREVDLMNNVLKKYGEGSLNIDTGVFIPTKLL